MYLGCRINHYLARQKKTRKRVSLRPTIRGLPEPKRPSRAWRTRSVTLRRSWRRLCWLKTYTSSWLWRTGPMCVRAVWSGWFRNS